MPDHASTSLGSRIGLAVVCSGLAAALIDGAYASTRSLLESGSASRVWQSLASGWLGPAAFEGGLPATLLGLATHFAIATAMAAAWVLADRRLRLVGARRYAVATTYGLGLYAVMYLVVLPLRWPSAFPQWGNWGSVLDIVAHVAVALTIAWVSARVLAKAPVPIAHGAAA